MAAVIGVLRELHRLRKHLKGLQEEIARAPNLVKAKHAMLSRQEQAVAAGHEELGRLKLLMREKEGTLKQQQQQVKKLEQQRNEVTSNKEYQAIQHEIADAKKKAGELEDQILEAMLAVDEKAATLPGLDQALAAAKEEAAAYEVVMKERVATLTAELERAQAELKGVEENLPEAFKQPYERLVALRGDEAMALVKGGTCAECHTELTQQQRNDLVAGRLVYCKACGRIAYLDDSAGES